MRGVVRIEIDGAKKTFGWQARRYFGRKTLSRFFSDSFYGGREGAYQAACEARAQMEAGTELPEKFGRKERAARAQTVDNAETAGSVRL